MTTQKCIYYFFCFIFFTTNSLAQTTPPNPTADRGWNAWWADNSVADVVQEFNAARRNEENQLGLPTGILGNLELPADYLQRSSEEQALILVNAEREARHGVNYPGRGVVSGLPFEGVDMDLNAVAQGHANDMLANNFFSHSGSDGKSSFQRIGAAFSGCTEGTGENIAWNSSGGFILSVPLAFYNFIYDDGACCNWGHRLLCLKQNINNNYGDADKIGLVGFGRASGSGGDYFVMNYLDPKPNCTYDVTNYGNDDGGNNCEDIIVVTGNITEDTYQAATTIESTGVISAGNDVSFTAGSSIVLKPGFAVNNNATFTASIDACDAAITTNTMASSRSTNPQKAFFKAGKPIIQTEHQVGATALSIAPNPAAYTTRLTYEMAEVGNVQIGLFDNMGRPLRILKEIYSSNEGKQVFDFSIADLQNGLYWISITTQNKVVTTSLVVHH